VQLAKKLLAANNIEVVQEDSQCDKNVAPEAIKRLIAQGVSAVIGDGCSSATYAALPEADKAKVVMISPSASSPKLSIADDYFFRVIPPDTFQGAFLAQSMYDRGIRTAGVFYTDEPYGQGMNDVFKQKFESLGGKVVAAVSAAPDVIDLTTQIQSIRKANPQGVFFAANSVVSTTAAIKLTRGAGITTPLFGADISYDTTIIKNAPTAVEGMTITSFPTGSTSFRQSLVNEYQVTEQLYGAAQAYDAFHAIYLANKRGAKTGEQIKAMLPDIKFDGVSAHIMFDDKGEISDPSYKYDLMQVKEGAFVKIN
jgi:branched-chain amino acid transport system substrate-binding protein